MSGMPPPPLPGHICRTGTFPQASSGIPYLQARNIPMDTRAHTVFLFPSAFPLTFQALQSYDCYRRSGACLRAGSFYVVFCCIFPTELVSEVHPVIPGQFLTDFVFPCFFPIQSVLQSFAFSMKIRYGRTFFILLYIVFCNLLKNSPVKIPEKLIPRSQRGFFKKTVPTICIRNH